jgi:hypothetical protein
MGYDIARLVKTVKGQHATLNALLAAAGRDENDLHVNMAGTLRTMLCDPELKDRCPTLLVLARELLVPLTVWGPFTKQQGETRPNGFRCWLPVIVSTTAVPIGLVGPWHLMSAADWIDAPIGALEDAWYTPKWLIQRVANREGGAHHQPKPDASLEVLKDSIVALDGSTTSLIGPEGVVLEFGKNSDFELRSALLQIAVWARDAAKQVLASAPV